MAVNTCDPALHSWVKSAEMSGTDFPIQNLPYGVARIPGEVSPRIVVAIGDQAAAQVNTVEAQAVSGEMKDPTAAPPAEQSPAPPA